jgi:hypothetical protein
MFLLKVITVALWLISIADIVNSKKRTLGEKIVLAIGVIAFPLVGSIVYLLAFREKEY